MNYDAEVLADAPLSYWKLDETSGTVAVDAMGAHDGTYPGDATLGVAGFGGGRAVELARHSPVSAGDVYRFPLRAAFSMEAWFVSTPLSLYLFDSQHGDGAEIFFSVLNAEWSFGRFSTTTQDFLDNDSTPQPGGWVHSVVTYDGTTMRMYVNSVDIGFTSGNPNGISNIDDSETALVLGYLEGIGTLTISKSAIYDHALSPERIAAHYAAGIAVGDTAPRAGLIHARRDGHGIGS